MFITQCYKYELNGIVYVGGNLPEGAEIIENMDILNAKEGYNLVRKSNNEIIGSSIWLKGEDSENNYIEVEVSDEEDS